MKMKPTYEDTMLTRYASRMIVIAAALVQTMTAAASAQSVDGERGHRIDIERAVRLEAEAKSLFDQPDKYGKAVRKLREAARLRPAEDRRAITSLFLAGVLAYHAEDFDAARAAMLERAERALSIGEVGVAADALINAAFAAKELNDAAAYDYIDRARLLANSTLLAARDRAIINKRIGDEPVTTAEDDA